MSGISDDVGIRALDEPGKLSYVVLDCLVCEVRWAVILIAIDYDSDVGTRALDLKAEPKHALRQHFLAEIRGDSARVDPKALAEVVMGRKGRRIAGLAFHRHDNRAELDLVVGSPDIR
jgi:hypothetical protein